MTIEYYNRDVAQLDSADEKGSVNLLRRGSTVGALQHENLISLRDVAQLGSAPRLGRGGRRFKSCHPDFSCFITPASQVLTYRDFLRLIP